ncbi:MAG: nucleoside triphosphate pyrophosphatase [Pseudomonadota bacterium]
MINDVAGKQIELILGSSSTYRAQILNRLRLPYRQISPAIDESPRAGEHPKALAHRLGIEKAKAVVEQYREAVPALVIGSDQTGHSGDLTLTKPGSVGSAVDMLLKLQGREATFYTSICLIRTDTEQRLCDTITTTVGFRNYTQDQLKRYVEVDQSQDCAGGFKVEALGTVLFKYVRSDDPTALIGLPLITLINMLINCSIDPIPN